MRIDYVAGGLTAKGSGTIKPGRRILVRPPGHHIIL